MRNKLIEIYGRMRASEGMIPDVVDCLLSMAWQLGECSGHGLGPDAFRLVIPGCEAVIIRHRHANSHFRCMLANLSCRCNQCVEDSTSPYGGTGRIRWGVNLIRVEFENTIKCQMFQLSLISWPDVNDHKAAD